MNPEKFVSGVLPSGTWVDGYSISLFYQERWTI